MLQKLKNQKFLKFWILKYFSFFSQFLNEFQLQVSGPSQQARWDNFFEYWNFYFTFLKAGVMIKNILEKILKIYIKMAFSTILGSGPPKSGLWKPIMLAHCLFLPKTRFWSCFSLLDPYFWLNFPPVVPIFCWPICWAPIGTFRGS